MNPFSLSTLDVADIYKRLCEPNQVPCLISVVKGRRHIHLVKLGELSKHCIRPKKGSTSTLRGFRVENVVVPNNMVWEVVHNTVTWRVETCYTDALRYRVSAVNGTVCGKWLLNPTKAFKDAHAEARSVKTEYLELENMSPVWKNEWNVCLLMGIFHTNVQMEIARHIAHGSYTFVDSITKTMFHTWALKNAVAMAAYEKIMGCII